MPSLEGLQHLCLCGESLHGACGLQFGPARRLKRSLHIAVRGLHRLLPLRCLLYPSLQSPDAPRKEISLRFEVRKNVGGLAQLRVDPLEAAFEFRRLAFRRVCVALELSTFADHITLLVLGILKSHTSLGETNLNCGGNLAVSLHLGPNLVEFGFPVPVALTQRIQLLHHTP